MHTKGHNYGCRNVRTHIHKQAHIYKHASVDTFLSHSRVDPISYDKQKSARLTENRTCGAAIKIQKTQQSLPRRSAARQGEKNKNAEFIDGM